MDERFGKFVRNKREEKKINLRKLAEILEIAPAYMSDMEKSRRYPPDKEKLAKIAEALELTEDEANTMYDYAALAKDNSVSPDLPEYIMETDNARVALRKARDLGLGDKEWMEVIKMLEEKEKEAKANEQIFDESIDE
mgnify:FL=1